MTVAAVAIRKGVCSCSDRFNLFSDQFRPANCKDTYCLGLKVPETCAVISSVGWVFDFANKH